MPHFFCSFLLENVHLLFLLEDYLATSSHLESSLFAWESCRHCSFAFWHGCCFWEAWAQLVFIPYRYFPLPIAQWLKKSLLLELISSRERITVLIIYISFVFFFSSSLVLPLGYDNFLLFCFLLSFVFYYLWSSLSCYIVFVSVYPLNYFYIFAFSSYWRKPDYVTPKYAYLTKKLFWAEGN